jgi:ribosomal protein S21
MTYMGFYCRLIDEGRMAGLEVERRFYETGSTAERAKTEAYMRRQMAERQRL